MWQRLQTLRRPGLAILAAVNLWWGTWALAAPANFFRMFPGFGHHWTAGYPPYNQHLVADLGATFITLGVLLVIATYKDQRQTTRVVLAGVFTFNAIHLAFHALHRGELAAFDYQSSIGTLVLGVLGPLAVFALTITGPKKVGRDPDYLRFMRRVEESIRNATPSTPQRRRANVSEAMREVRRVPVGEVRDLLIDGRLPARLYRPVTATDTLLVFFHGGGWCIGDLDSWDPIVRTLVDATGVAMLAIDYRLAPEHPYPAAIDDAEEAVRWALAHHRDLDADRIGVAGDSAGGTIAAAVANRLAGPDVRLALQLLIYPAVDLRQQPPIVPDPDRLQLYRGDTDENRRNYVAAADPSHPDVSPLLAPDVSDAPPTVIVTAEYDRLRPQGLAYAEKLRQAGVPLEIFDAAQLDHAFVGWVQFAKRPAAAVSEIGQAVRRMLRV
jgi:acetyl esterase